jgi:hypothetical protein
VNPALAGNVLPLTKVALMLPVPIAVKAPASDIEIPFATPWAVTTNGNAVDVPTVLMLTNAPVRVLPVVSMKLKTGVVDTPESAAPISLKSTVDGAT